MTNETTMRTEAERVRAAVLDMIAQIEVEGGDVRAFTAALTTAAVEMQLEVFGPEGMNRFITGLAEGYAAETGAGRA